jgi:hypothetical protein
MKEGPMPSSPALSLYVSRISIRYRKIRVKVRGARNGCINMRYSLIFIDPTINYLPNPGFGHPAVLYSPHGNEEADH